MSRKPDDIPQDVWDAAQSLYDAVIEVEPFTSESLNLIARAILAERERCALIADEAAFDDHALAQATDHGRGADAAARQIAAAIRKGGV